MFTIVPFEPQFGSVGDSVTLFAEKSSFERLRQLANGLREKASNYVIRIVSGRESPQRVPAQQHRSGVEPAKPLQALIHKETGEDWIAESRDGAVSVLRANLNSITQVRPPTPDHRDPPGLNRRPAA
jgi:hypothetical protein